jgi:PRTRC genetic system ThiF family protein
MKHALPSHFINGRLRLIVAGCGGNGSQMLNGLARLHCALQALGHHGLEVTAVDPDTVSEANIGRQLFSPADVGQPKAAVLINRINLFYGLDWTAIKGRVCEHRGHHGLGKHILIGCVDSIRARQQIGQYGRFYADYWLDLGNTDKKGQVILGEFARPARGIANLRKPETPSRLPHVLDIFPELQKKNVREDTAPSCSLAEALDRQDLFINQWLATAALQLLWQFIRQGGLDIHGYFINLETNRVTPLPIR